MKFLLLLLSGFLSTVFSFHNRIILKPLASSIQRKALNLFPDPTIIPIFQQAVVVTGVQGVALTVLKQKFLTQSGLYHAAALGIGLWTLLGPQGWAVCVGYLILGNIVTKFKMLEKEVS